MTRILGIDPGSRITGFGIVDLDGPMLRYIDSGVIRATADTFSARIGEIFRGTAQIIELHAPQWVVVEQVFVKSNVSSALKLGQARGAVLSACALAELEVFEYTPAQIKQALVGKGNAMKEQVQHMIRATLRLPATPSPDAADALAAAVCHCHLTQTQRRLLKPRKAVPV